MACSKYTLTNTGTTVVNFNYRRCDDSMWEYQVNLDPNQTKNIWLINGTYDTAQIFESSIVLVNDGAYPLTPTPTRTPTSTPTNTPTPSVTTTNTPTPSITASQTQTNTPTITSTPTNTPTLTSSPTPTNIVRTVLASICHDEGSSIDACGCLGTATLYVNGPNMAGSTLAWADQFGVNTGDPQGYYVQNGIIYLVATNCGIGCGSGSTISVYGTCPTPTPTSTTTPTVTPTQTVTPTNAYDTFSITSGSTANAACAGGLSGTIYAENSLFDANTQFYNNPNGTVSGNMSGYYSYGGQVVQLNSDGSLTTGIYTLCSVVPTLTPTPTNTVTPTTTTTPTTTPTATFGYYTYSLGTGATSNDACIDFGSAPNTIYGTVAGGIGPNVGEYLYFNTALTIAVADGYYSNGTGWYEVTGGAGQITSADPTGC